MSVASILFSLLTLLWGVWTIRQSILHARRMREMRKERDAIASAVLSRDLSKAAELSRAFTAKWSL
jgi:hypothetical protein